MSESLLLIVIAMMVVGAILLLMRVAKVGYSTAEQRFTDTARTQLEESFDFRDPKYLFLLTIIGTVAVAALAWYAFGGFVVPLLASTAALFAPKVYFGFQKKRRRLKIVAQLPDVLLMLGSSLRAGTSLQIALDIAIRETPAPLSQELGVVVREQRLGLALEDALESMATRLSLEEVELVVAAMTIARDVGGNLAETLDQLARTLRAKATMEGKIRSLTSQGKMQGWIVGALPLFLMLALSYMQHDAMQPLFHTWMGLGVLVFIGILETLGYLFIRKIVTIDV
ncbi:MAG TPA: type II secretion system F family protein [Steroidobacteraceae bacterium]|nr:type II secretion system F family protein [Steroidobacteraceae bacterium]